MFSKKRTREIRKHHHVYVVMLDECVAKFKKVQRLNPQRDPELPCIYVGMTGLTPEERFKKHLEGYKSSGWVHKYGLRLLYSLTEGLNPMTYEEAVYMEAHLAEELRERGYTVLGGH
jgi:hypothetical protein